MPKTHQTSKHKWRREKFWAFVLLGLNRMFNHDPLPPWGFEFLLWVNCQAWWHYTHYGFHARYEPRGWNAQGDGESLSDAASFGERMDRNDVGEEQKGPGDPDSTPESRTESMSGGKIPQPPWDPTDQYRRRQYCYPTSDPSKEDNGCAPRRIIPERKLPARGFSLGSLPRCPVSRKFEDTGTCVLRDSYRKEDSEASGLLPKFDWEKDDVGEYFGDFL